MPTRTTPWPAGTPCWIDVAARDIPAACDFYAGVFGWDAAPGDPAFGGYSSATVDGHRVAGIGPLTDEGAAPSWTTYFSTEDVEATCAAITAAGGTVAAPPMQVGPLGSMAIAADPTGAVFGLWQAAEHPGVELYNQHGGLVWNEAAVADPVAARAFYSAVFGWQWDPVEGMDTYQTFRLGERWLGGLGGPEDGVPGWSACFAVTDTDATVAAVTERSGSVVQAAQDTTYGRFAVLADPQGAPFSVLRVSPEADGNG